jgi:hypothetical protein
MLFDYTIGARFLQLWLEAAAAAAGDVEAGSEAGLLTQPTPCFSRRYYQQCAAAADVVPAIDPQINGCIHSTDQHHWTQQQQQQQQQGWSVPDSLQGSLAWLEQHSSGNSPSMVRSGLQHQAHHHILLAKLQ